jgi:hypothetical protein
MHDRRADQVTLLIDDRLFILAGPGLEARASSPFLMASCQRAVAGGMLPDI